MLPSMRCRREKAVAEWRECRFAGQAVDGIVGYGAPVRICIDRSRKALRGSASVWCSPEMCNACSVPTLSAKAVLCDGMAQMVRSLLTPATCDFNAAQKLIDKYEELEAKP